MELEAGLLREETTRRQGAMDLFVSAVCSFCMRWIYAASVLAEAWDVMSSITEGAWKVGPATSAGLRTVLVAEVREGGRKGQEPRAFPTQACIRTVSDMFGYFPIMRELTSRSGSGLITALIRLGVIFSPPRIIISLYLPVTYTLFGSYTTA